MSRVSRARANGAFPNRYAAVEPHGRYAPSPFSDLLAGPQFKDDLRA